MTTHSKEPDVLNAVTDDPDKLYDTVLVTYSQKPPEVKAAIAKAAAANIGIIAMKTQAGGYQTRELYHSKREFNHKTATERDKATVEKSLLALNWIRVSWFRAAAPASTTPASSTPSCAACSDSRAHFAAPPP